MAKKTDEFDYSQKAAELESILAALQNPDIQIDEATKLHAKGMKLVGELENYLEKAENTVRKHSAER